MLRARASKIVFTQPGPTAEVAARVKKVTTASFYELRRLNHDRRREGDAQCLGGLQVDDKIEYCQLLNRRPTPLITPSE